MSMDRQTRTGEVLRRLLTERSIGRFALFLVQEEGIELPGGLEAVSGFVLASTGEVFGFWLDWDADRGSYFLDPWYPVDDVSEFAGDAEYLEARRTLGLDG
jgi:hypothetical protein